MFNKKISDRFSYMDIWRTLIWEYRRKKWPKNMVQKVHTNLQNRLQKVLKMAQNLTFFSWFWTREMTRGRVQKKTFWHAWRTLKNHKLFLNAYNCGQLNFWGEPIKKMTFYGVFFIFNVRQKSREAGHIWPFSWKTVLKGYKFVSEYK